MLLSTPLANAVHRHFAGRHGRSTADTSARALGHALAGTGLAAGLHHVTTDSTVSRWATMVAVAVLTSCMYCILRADRLRAGSVALAAPQSLLPLWLGLTDTHVPTAGLDGHARLPSVWHHNTVAIAVLNCLAALALAWVVCSAAGARDGLVHGVADWACRWWQHLRHLIGLVLHLVRAPRSAPDRPLPPETALPHPCFRSVLLHRLQPSGP
ncbi:hypothetical protein SALBM135S_07614 [Streptomyces alboniger]